MPRCMPRRRGTEIFEKQEFSKDTRGRFFSRNSERTAISILARCRSRYRPPPGSLRGGRLSLDSVRAYRVSGDGAAAPIARHAVEHPRIVRTGPSFKGTELGEVLIPAIYPFSWKHPDEAVWLGRVDGLGRRRRRATNIRQGRRCCFWMAKRFRSLKYARWSFERSRPAPATAD